MEGMAGQPSNTANDDTSIPGIPTSLDLEFPCTTWEEVRQLLLLWQVPATDLPYWETLWRWGQIKASATTGQAEPATLVERSMEFCRRIQGTKESYECLVPERDGRMGTLCETIIGRRDRMRSHMGSHHLGVSEFPCEGQCGNNDWQVFLQKRYLHEHINPNKDPCPQCGKVMYKRNMSTHRC